MAIVSYKTYEDYCFYVSKKISEKPKQIILNGYIEENKDLKQYFLREFKKALALDYSETEFFGSLLEVISLFKEQIQRQIDCENFRIKIRLTETKGSVNFDSPEAKRLIQALTDRLKQIKPEDEFLELSQISQHKVNKKMPYVDLLSVEYAITQARIEVLSETTISKNNLSLKQSIVLKDFFPDLSIQKIEAIQKKFKSKGDQEIAILIDYLLEKEIIELVVNNKTGKSRASFYKLLKEDEFKNTTVFNRMFIQGTNRAKFTHNDPVRAEVNKTVDKLL